MSSFYFAIIGHDRPDALPRREAARDEHRVYLRTPHPAGAEALLGGPLLDDAGRMNGTLVVVRAPSRHAAELFLAGDPYTAAGIFEHVEVRPWGWALGAPVDDGNSAR